MIATSAFYDQNAQTFFDQYRSLTTPEVLGNAVLAVPVEPSLVLDIGSGSGRDSEWLAAQGHTVISVEPAKALRDLARSNGQARNIIHFDSTLPDLRGLDQFAGGFDFVLCSAVWMHLDVGASRVGAYRLNQIMKPGATAVVTFKVAPPDLKRMMHKVDPESIAGDFRTEGFDIEMNENADLLGRDDTRWYTCILRKRD